MLVSARQVKEFSEIGRDKKAAEDTLKIALSHHANVLNSLLEKEGKLWEEVAEIHGLDLTKADYRIDYSRARIVVVPVE